MSQQRDRCQPGVDVVYTSWACCDTLTKTMNVKERKSFSEQPHLDLEFTTSNAEKHSSGELHYHLIAREKDSKRVYIAFKGTENTNDAIVDLKIYRSFGPYSGPGGVHAGFDLRAKEIPILTIVGLLNRGIEVVVTGYSLGGAVALLVLFRILSHDKAQPQSWLEKRLLQCITFGSPYVGDTVFLDQYVKYNDIIHNFVNTDDIVPRSLSMGNPLKLFVPDYKPIGRFHTVRFGERCGVTWDGEAPVFTLLSNQINNVNYHVCYYNGLLQALGDPLVTMDSTPTPSSTLEDICPQISHYEWDPSSSTFSVYGRHLHEKLWLDIDGVPNCIPNGTNGKPPNCAVEVMAPILPDVITYKIRAGNIDGKCFNIQSHIPYYDVGGISYVRSDHVPITTYQSARVRSRMLTLSQLLVGQIVLHALRSFTTGKFENEDLLKIIDQYVTPAMQQASPEFKAFDIISVVAIYRLHQNDMNFVEKLFESNPTNAVLGITDPTFLQRQTAEMAKRFRPAGTLDFWATEVVDLIAKLNKSYPYSHTYPQGGHTPRPVAVDIVMQSLADLGNQYGKLVYGAQGEQGSNATRDPLKLDEVEKNAQYQLQCLQCTWLAVSLRLYWQQLKLSIRRDQQSVLRQAVSWVTGGLVGGPITQIDYEYEKRVKEMAHAIHVSTEGRELWEYERSVSAIEMPSPDRRSEWSEFVEIREMLQFGNWGANERLQNERLVYNTWKLIKVVSETRKSKERRFLIAVMGPTKSGKGTLLYNSLAAKSQFGTDLNTICPRLYDVTETTAKWKEDLIFTAGERAPLFEAIDMPSIDDVTATEGKNQFQLTHQLCPILDAVVILLKAPGLNDSGVNRILEMVKINSRCKVLLTIGHLERFWDDVTVMNTSKPFDPDDDDPDDETETVSGQAERAATTILALLEKLNVDSWKDRIEIVLTDVRYKSSRQCNPSTMAKYNDLVERLRAKERPLKFSFTIEIRKWLQDRFVEYCVEWDIACRKTVD